MKQGKKMLKHLDTKLLVVSIMPQGQEAEVDIEEAVVVKEAVAVMDTAEEEAVEVDMKETTEEVAEEAVEDTEEVDMIITMMVDIMKVEDIIEEEAVEAEADIKVDISRKEEDNSRMRRSTEKFIW